MTWCQSNATPLGSSKVSVQPSCPGGQTASTSRLEEKTHQRTWDMRVPFDDELPSADFDFAEPFEDDATAGPTKSEPFEDEAAVDLGVDEPFEDDAASTFGAALKRGFALVIVTEVELRRWSAQDCPADDDDFATPLGLGTKRVASEVD